MHTASRNSSRTVHIDGLDESRLHGSGIFSWGGSCRGCYSFIDRAPTVVAKRICDWESCSSAAVSENALVLVSTPGWAQLPRGFPALTARSGQFLPNNVVFLGAAIWSPGEAPTPKEKPTIKP